VTLGVVASAMALSLYSLLDAASLTNRRAGRAVLFVGIVVLPLGAVATGLSYSLHRSQQTAFCLSCHEMAPYGRSLWVDDDEMLPAFHYQRRLVPRATACYTCHSDYALFGDVTTKLNGLRHVYVHFLGQVPDEIKLYEPYPNANCLSCHDGERSFEESSDHETSEVTFAQLRSGQVSCLECHDVAHAVDDLDDAELWKPPRRGL
jgi:cytochrome c-type protein NapC